MADSPSPGTPRPSSRQASPAASGSPQVLSLSEFPPDLPPPTQQTCVLCAKVPVEPISLYCCQALYCNSCLADYYYETSKPHNAKCKQCGRMILLPIRTQPLVELRRKSAAFAAAQLKNSFHPYKRPPTSGAGLGHFQCSSGTSAASGTSFGNTITTSSSTTQMAAKIQSSPSRDGSAFIKDVMEFRWDKPHQAPIKAVSTSKSFEKEAEKASDSGKGQKSPTSSVFVAPTAPANEEVDSILTQLGNKRLIDPDMIQKLWEATVTQKELAEKLFNNFIIKEADPFAIEERMKVLQAKDPTKLIGPVCIICLDGSKEPVKSKCCGRMACRKCWTKVIGRKLICPGCFKGIEEDEVGFVDPFKEFLKKKDSCIPLGLSIDEQPATVLGADVNHVDYKDFLGKFKDLDDYSLSVVIHLLKSVREEKYRVAEKDNKRRQLMQTTAIGYYNMLGKYTKDYNEARKYLTTAYQDVRYLNNRMAKESFAFGSYYGTGMDFSDQKGAGPNDDPEMVERLEEDPVVLEKVGRLRAHFDVFSNALIDIFKMHEKYSTEDHARMSHNRMDTLIEFTEGITKYKNVTKVATLNYDAEPNSAMAIITGLAFDPTASRFAVAGVSKKIKVFDFNNLLKNPDGPHFPEAFFTNKGKVSSIGWNPFEENILAAADYDGHVSIWDINKTKNVVKTFKDHKKRCLALDFSKNTRNIFATGSEDNKVNLYNINGTKVVSKIPCVSNVCCVQFSPFNPNYLFYGVADHNLYLVDLRQANRPLKIFRGHTKAVAYCKNINEREVVTASTDNSLRIWNIESGNCVNILRGHYNEKNFVGLDNNGDHIVCGSEDTRCFFYYKGMQRPIAEDTITKGDSYMDGNEGFVSAVAWKPESDLVLAANSCGRIQLLHLS